MLGKLNHVAIAVKNISSAAKTYKKIFGAQVSEPLDQPIHGVTVVFVTLENTKIENNVSIGPYARIRPGSILKSGSKVGNFVEVKKSIIGKGSRANHLSYIGDTTLGRNVNIGAGTITCNYDGKKKHKTKIKNSVFVGSNSSLVAPVTIGEKSIIGAGSVITKNVKKKSLALTRSLQTEIKNYKRKSK